MNNYSEVERMRRFSVSRTEKGDVGKRRDVTKQKYFDLQKMKDGFLLEQKCRGNSEETVKYYDWKFFLAVQQAVINDSIHFASFPQNAFGTCIF
jgi:hypothetical protein